MGIRRAASKDGYRLHGKGRVYRTRQEALTQGGTKNVPLAPLRERVAAAEK